MGKVNLQIDDYEIEADAGKSVLEAALEAGIYIPHLCYHPDLVPAGNCKLCCVSVDGKLQQSCEVTAEEGMVIETKTEDAKNRQILALELLLASHPKDCTSCDKYLNCELQALLQYMGVGHSRLREIEKENTRIAKSDALIKREMQRCIQCGRCVRACKDYRGVGVLTMNRKNGETYISTKGDVPLNETDCRFCGACVEVCPTGAIQDMAGGFASDAPRQRALVPCREECPAHTDIPEYIRLVEEGRHSDAVSVIREKLTFPHSLGIVCTHKCESGCKRNHVNDSLSIRELKRIAVVNDTAETWRDKGFQEEKNGRKIAVVGGGPAGMTAAYYLAKKGYETEVFEKMPKAGGMLSFGIPKYRLPQEAVDREIEILTEAGIILHTDAPITSLDQLKEENFDAVLVTVGSDKGKRPPEYDKPWSNAIDAVDFCKMANLGQLPELGDTVTVYGGGNVGFDCARTAKINGVQKVRVICMEDRENMTADEEEINAALDEGVELLSGHAIAGFQEESGMISGLSVVGLNSFRFTPAGLELDIRAGSEQNLKTDTMIFATSQQPDLSDSFGLAFSKGTHIQADEGLQTSAEGVFAAGDAVYGTNSVVRAIASGREAAENIDKYLGGDGVIDEVLFEREALSPQIGVIEGFAGKKRSCALAGVCAAKKEASRCLQCDLRLQIQKDKVWVDQHYKSIKGVKV